MSCKPYSQEEIEFLKINGPIMTREELAQKLERPLSSIRYVCTQHKVPYYNPPCEIGDKIYKITILRKYLYNKRTWIEGRCECGNKTKVRLTALSSGSTKSCGCYKRSDTQSEAMRTSRKHLLPFYKKILSIWAGIKNRCYNKKNIAFKNYGAKNISVCNEWLNFDNFYQWTIENNYQLGLTLDRINVKGNYEPQNCRWATIYEQVNNTSRNRKITAFGETKNLTEWFRDDRCKCSLSALRGRLEIGWEVEKAIITPSFNKSEDRNNISDSSRILTAFGKTQSLTEWAKDPMCKVTKLNLKSRLNRGWSIEEAISKPSEDTFTITNIYDNLYMKAFNEIKTFTDWSEDNRCQVNCITLYTRIINGVQPEQALLR